MSVSQSIIVVKGQSPKELVSLSVRAGMEIMCQFDPTKTSYSGDVEKKQFSKDYNEWVENDCKQNLFIADSSDLLNEIELYCNMEGAPTNFINSDSETKVLIIGPFDSERLKYYTQNCTEM